MPSEFLKTKKKVLNCRPTWIEEFVCWKKQTNWIQHVALYNITPNKGNDIIITVVTRVARENKKQNSSVRFDNVLTD